MSEITFGVNIIPANNTSLNLGSNELKWENVYINQINGNTYIPLPTVSVNDNGKFLKVNNGTWIKDNA